MDLEKTQAVSILLASFHDSLISKTVQYFSARQSLDLNDNSLSLGFFYNAWRNSQRSNYITLTKWLNYSHFGRHIC